MLTSFLGWVLNTLKTAAEAEMNDDAALREQLLEAEMRREMGEISNEEFEEIEAELLVRIREIKQRREGGGPLTTGGAVPIETSPDSRFEIEASVTGDFHDPSQAPHTTIVETEPGFEEKISVLDMERRRTKRANRTAGTTRTARTGRTIRTSGKLRSS